MHSGAPPVTAADFPGCYAERVTHEQFALEERHVEYWDGRREVAYICADNSAPHARPPNRLAVLMHRIALARGAEIECYGNMTLYERRAGLADESDEGEAGRRRIWERAMEADQLIYLDVARARVFYSQVMVLGEHAPPDIVVEVDNTTDVRRKKLSIYEEWAFPEVWVEVPDAPAKSRPKSRKSGLTIYHLNKRGRFEEVPASAALPGWRDEEIHLALNEGDISIPTYDALERTGLALGRQEGTGPANDPFMRKLFLESRAEGRQEGRDEGLAEGRLEAVAAERRLVAERILAQRGISCSPGVFADARFLAAGTTASVVDAALACRDTADFLAALGGGAA